MTTPEILAHIEREHQEAVLSNDAAQAKVQSLTARLDDVRAKMAGISERRIAGTATDQEAAEYAALGGDLTLLEKMLTEARSAAKLATDTVHGAYISYTNAQQAHQRAQKQAAFQALKERTINLEAMFIRALGLTAKAGKELGHSALSQSYQPGEELRRAVHYNVAPQVEV